MARDDGKKKVSRKATYDSGRRIARLINELGKRPQGWSYEDIEEDLGISRRTLQRYVEACRLELMTDDGEPAIETFLSGGKPMVRFAAPDRLPSGSGWEVLSLFFGLRLAHVLEETVFGDLNDEFFERVRASVSKEDAEKIRNLDRKLYALPSMPRDYRDKDGIVDAALKAVIEQSRMRIDYRGVVGEGRTHDFDPYSLVEHRGGLYLLGKSHLEGKILWLAIERIASLQPVRDETGKPIRFAYPPTFDPARYTDGMFGVFDGEKRRVVLTLRNEATESYLRARRLHSTQKFFTGPDGRTHLEMTVRGTHELLNWLMSSSPWVEVVSPADLREEIAERLRQSAAVYAPARPPERAQVESPLRREKKPGRRTRSAWA